MKNYNNQFRNNNPSNEKQTEKAIAPTPPITPKAWETGVVSNCEVLNVRSEPNVDADVIGSVTKNTELIINVRESNDEFYKVRTAAGLDGFCMRTYVSFVS